MEAFHKINTLVLVLTKRKFGMLISGEIEYDWFWMT